MSVPVEKRQKSLSLSGKLRTALRSASAVDFAVLFLTLLVDALMVRTVGVKNLRKDLGKGRLLLIALFNLLILAVIAFGPPLKKWLCQAHARALKIVDWLLLACTPALQFVLVQLVLDKKMKVSGAYIWKNLLIYYWVAVFLLLLLRKASRICTISGFFWMALALTEYYVLGFRGQAFTVADIFGARTAANVLKSYHFEISPALCAVLLAFFLYEVFQSRFQQLMIGKHTWKNIALRIAVLAVLAVVPFLQKGFFIAADNLNMFRIDLQYSEKGYVYVLTGEITYLSAQEPEGYSPEAVREIAQDYMGSGAEKSTMAAEAENVGTENRNVAAEAENAGTENSTAAADTDRIIPENVIVVMIESFADIESGGNLAADTEILPNLHNLQKQDNVKSGSLYVPTFGGGTCETEYEVLTGNYVQFLPSASLVYQFYTREPEYGLASSFGSQGYRTVAVHPNRPYAWNREKVYSAMGFDEFINTNNWGAKYKKIRDYASDTTVYDRIIQLYEDKEPGEKLFTFGVTIQNHGGYGQETLGSYEPDVTLNYETDYPEAEAYLSLAKESDRALMELISYFEKTEEPTMIVFFGDHWPNLGNEFLTQLQAETGLTEVEKQRVRYSTPYLIWTNYPSESAQEDMSANYLGAYILSEAGLSLTPWQQFQLAMRKEIPALTVGSRAQTSDGTWQSLTDLPENLSTWISNYKILEYNNVFDRRNRLAPVFSGQ